MKINSVIVALIVLLITVLLIGGLAAATEKTAPNRHSSLSGDKELLLPANYQSWVVLSPTTPGVPKHRLQHLVSKVYVEPAAYEGFVKHGAWPDHTVIVLELRDKETPARTPCDGVIGLEVATKNSSRLPDPWSYYGIIYDQHKHAASAAAPMPKPVCAGCKDQPDDQPMDMRLAMYFPALRAVIEGTPRTMLPSAF